MHKTTVLICGLMLHALAAMTQTVNAPLSPTPFLQDSVVVKASPERPMLKPRFNTKMLILPAALIGYGITSIKSETLKDVNEEVKEELWTEHAHKRLPVDDYLQWAPAAAVFGLNALGIKGKHTPGDQALIYGLSTAIMASTVFATKNLSQQWRPDDSNNRSFPSGHTATAFAAAEFLRKEYQGVSPWYGVAGYAAAATTGYLRMYNNKHWLSDVVAGAGIGILTTDLAYYLYPSVKKLFGRKGHGGTVVAPYYQHGTAGISFVHRF